MQVIIGHTNADFDCLASMVAAKKIFPDAFLVFPGAIEENVRKFLLLYGNNLNITSLKQIDMAKISELVIVDTRQKDRIGIFGSLLGHDNLKIYLYDHHPSSENDIQADISKIKQTGATTTILLEIMIKKNIPINYFESTLFALGIYEDTGSLTFSTTTKEDIGVLNYLFSIGVNLRTVNKFTNIGLNLGQKKLLNQLMLSSDESSFKGVTITFAKGKTSEYMEGLALVTHKLIEIVNSDIIFVLVQMKNKIYVVGRSNRNSVNVGEILKEIGGGGHSQAASAVMRKHSLSEAEDDIKKILDYHIELETLAKNIMTSPVKTLDVNTSIEEAQKIMLRYGHNGFPVTDKNKLVGIITRQEIAKAKQHHYGKETVDVYMSENIISVQPKTPILEIQQLMIDYNVGRVLVLDKDGKLEGIVTRTDLIRNLYGERNIKQESYSLFEKRNEQDNANKGKIKSLMIGYFPKDILDILYQIGQIGDQLGYSVFMVGGIVRDLFLKIPNLDLDIVIEEDAIRFAHYFSSKVSGKIRSHHKFKTAVVILPNGLKIDFASARREFYEYPAALPKIEFASIKKDLYRRDFTINSMAIQLNQNKFGELFDFFGGKKDLELKQIRILYSLSFTEDPARIIRAVRFEQRYHFDIEPSTKKFFNKAIKEGLISRIRKKRRSEEFLIILREKEPVKVLKRMEELGILPAMIPNLTLNAPVLAARFKKVEARLNQWYKKFPKEYVDQNIVFLYYLLELSGLEIDYFLKKIELTARAVTKLKRMIEEKDTLFHRLVKSDKEPSYLFFTLKDKPNELLFVLCLENEKNPLIVNSIKSYLDDYKKRSVFISGNDLINLGMNPGPIYAKILKLLFYLQLNGILKDKKEEISFVKKLIEKRII